MQEQDSRQSPARALTLRHSDGLHYHCPEQNVPDFQPGPQDTAFLRLLEDVIRSASADKAEIDASFSLTVFPQRFYRLILTLYAPGQKRILVSRADPDGKLNFSTVLERLLVHPRLKALAALPFHLQVDFMGEPPVAMILPVAGAGHTGMDRFEFGIDGLIINGPDGKTHLFLPGDSFVRSIMTMGQLLAHLNKVHGEGYLRLARFKRFRVESFVSVNGAWQRLYRGYPVVGALTKEKIEHAVELAIDHIRRNQSKDGKFLYYYDTALDSRWDREHPKRDPDKNPYYNILRHCGGGLTCIFHEKYAGRGATFENIRRAIDYLLTHARLQDYDGREGAFIYHEKKAKLGGSGIALYLLAEYQLLTGDDRYRPWADKFAWHLFNQITSGGEFIYYNIYLDRQVSEKENQRYFSFYYPGEAVCGLGKYLHLVPTGERRAFFEKLRQAMEFLLVERPRTRAEHYTIVPSDSWLMMGIKELWDFEEMRNPLYADFVFSDAAKMIDQLYKVTDAPYPDYAGAFYYQYGDYPYADGARCEGLLGAYELAVNMGEKKIARQIWQALRLAAWAVMHLVNTKEAVYFARNPELALGGIRFKYTRQWFRIDTIQHVASFYAKLLPHWDRAEAESTE